MAEREWRGEGILPIEDVEDVETGTPEAPPPETDPAWTALLQYLLQARGFDFHGYKPASLARRIRTR